MARGNHRIITNSEEDADLILNDEDPMVEVTEEPGTGPVIPIEEPSTDDGEVESEF